MLKKLLSLFPFVFIAISANALDVKLCYEDGDSFPWTLKDGTGLSFVQFKVAQKELSGINFKFDARPWKRCLEDIKNNEVDGLFSASFKKDRMEIGVYPGLAVDAKDGKPDDDKRLHTSEYSLYVRKDSKVDWDGSKFINASVIGIQNGYSIIDLIKEKGLEAKEVSKAPEVLFKTVLNKGIDGAALLTFQADMTLKNNKEYENIKKIDIPLVKKTYFLMFSRKFMKSHEAEAQKIWSALAKARESDEFKQAMKK